MYTNTVYTLFKDQQLLHFNAAVHRDSHAVHGVGVIFWSADPKSIDTLCVQPTGQKIQEFRHSEDCLLTLEAARQIWNTLINWYGWSRQ